MVWAGGRSCTGSSWVSPAFQVSRDTGQLLSPALLAQALPPIFSSLLNPAELPGFPKCAAAPPRSGREGLAVPVHAGLPGGPHGKGGLWAAPGGCQHGLGLSLATRG